MLGSVLFNVLTGHLEKDEVRNVTKHIMLCKVVRTSTNHEELQRNRMYLSKKISQNIYSRSGKCSEKGQKIKGRESHCTRNKPVRQDTAVCERGDVWVYEKFCKTVTGW